MGNYPVTIVVNPGNFSSIGKAGHSENQVNFWDDDLADDDACTECFAAVELKRFLAVCTDIQDNTIKLNWKSSIPGWQRTSDRTNFNH